LIVENDLKSMLKNNADKDGIFTPEILDFIFENFETEKIYTHYTYNESIAKLIMAEGFKYVDSFYKTTQNIHNDLVVLNYKHNLYEHYGEYIIIICIPDELINYIKKEINLSKFNLTVEDYISKTHDNNDELYILPPIFVKGYIKYKTADIIKNPLYKNNYSLSDFIQRLCPLD